MLFKEMTSGPPVGRSAEPIESGDSYSLALTTFRRSMTAWMFKVPEADQGLDPLLYAGGGGIALVPARIEVS